MKMIASKILETIKPMEEKLMNSTLYNLVIRIAKWYATIAITCYLFFGDEFRAKTITWTILLIAFALILLSKVLDAVFKQGKKSEVVFWILVFLSYVRK